ncbi:MAG: hypothetical protein A2Y10_11380 [Planctomycetes bacterium GWF2_41_51]|nr:MAG: hypothetical protein A2Y10_11380 [Planctomycetes bacterium GWF2_41_51]HBG26361.1 hypothetical protein [Phycisphaerales bacterium]
MSKNEHHVVPNKKVGGWDVKRAGSEKASVHTETKQQAIDKGRQISQNQNTEFVIHNKNGRISEKDSHGNDQFPPKG